MRALAAVAVFALVGCNATMPQQQIGMTAADDPSKTCFESLPTNANWSVLSAHIPLADPRQATTQMLADAAKPTDADRDALSQWANARKLCGDMGTSFRQRFGPPGVAGVYERQQMALLQTIASLYAGNITFGQFNAQRLQVGMQASAEYDNLRARNEQQATQARQADQSQAVQSLQMLQLLQAMQPRPAPMPSLIQPQVNCTSFRSGNVVQTNCN